MSKKCENTNISDITTNIKVLHNWLSEVGKYGMTTISVDLVKNKLQSIINEVERGK